MNRNAPVGRQWATSGHPEAHVVTNTVGERFIAYSGTEGALTYLECIPGAQYASGQAVKVDDIAGTNGGNEAGPRAWLVLPCDRTSFVLLETVGKLQAVSDRYQEARRAWLGTDGRWLRYYPSPPPGIPVPFQHQREAFDAALAAFGRGARGFANWGEMGIGKSRWAVDLTRGLRARVTLVLIQKVTADQWRCCVENVFPEAELIELVGNIPVKARRATIQGLVTQCRAKARTRPVVLTMNWDVLRLLVDDLLRLQGHLDLVVADEVTRARKRTSQVSRALRKLAKGARWRVPMTGTPVSGDPTDLWAQMAFQDDRIFDKKFEKFVRRYFMLSDPDALTVAGIIPQRLPELVALMYANAHRAIKANISDMPPKMYRTVSLAPDPVQAKLYRKLTRDFEVEVPDGRLTVASTIALCTRQQQVSAGILPLNDVADQEEGAPATVKQIPSAKTAWLVEYCREAQETGDAKILVWTQFKAEIDRLTEELSAAGVTCDKIDGRTNVVRRKDILTRFSDRADPLRVILVNISVGAYGLDLPVVDVMVYHSSTFKILERMQSEDRGHRLGRSKDRPYEIVDLVLQGTIDEDIEQARRKRMDLIAMLVQQGQGQGP